LPTFFSCCQLFSFIYLTFNDFFKIAINFLSLKGLISLSNVSIVNLFFILSKIYAGDFHAQSYRKFLKEVLDFDQIEKAGKVEKFRIEGEPLDLEKFRVDGETLRCINMKTISQPFFSEWPPKRIVK
jgi:hypothetical protein